jgi:basic membrane protein A and related proteins
MMRCRRLMVIAMSAIALTIAACGSDSSSTEGTATATASKGCGYAVVFPTPIGPSQSERALADGMKRAAAAAGTQVTIVESRDQQSFATNLQAVAAKKCYAAIGTSFFASGAALQQVAKQFPSQKFFITDGFVQLKNVTNFAVAPEQLTYIAGAMAASLTKTKKIGIVLGDDSPTLLRFKNGFQQGAALIDPTVKVSTSYVGSFTDPAKSATLAVAQAGKGIDLVYPASGSNLEIYSQAKGHDYRAIASDPTEYAQARAKGAAIAFVSIIDQAAQGQQALAAVIAGKATGGVRELGLKDGVFNVPGVIKGASPYPLPSNAIAAGKRAFDGLESGKLKVSDPAGS